MRLQRHLIRWTAAVALLLITGLVATPSRSQEATAEPDDSADWIAHTLRDDMFNDYAIAITDTNGERVMEIPISADAPDDYSTRCDAPLKWSPDGTQLAFVRQLSPDAMEQADANTDLRELIAVNVETGERQIVTDALFRTFDWSPDSAGIVHDTDIDYGNQGEDAESSGLYVLDLESGESEQIIAPVDGNPLWRPQWSPDGEHIGFYAVQGIEGLGQFMLAEADGSEPVAWRAATVGAFDWSPDGSQIVFDNVLYTAQESQLAVAAADTANSAEDVDIILEDMTPTQPQWSPDGSAVAFLNQDSGAVFHTSLWLLELESGEPRQILSGNIRTFDWSPDGMQLVAGTESGIRVVPRSGDSPQTIADSGGCPAWRPDGS